MSAPRIPSGLSRSVLALLFTVLVWCFFAWPLPRFVRTGIPCASENAELGAVRRMIQGDHLQLMYFMWLGADMLSGHTRPLYNVYEFNAGDDGDRFQARTYYFPFCAAFGALAPFAGRSAAYNALGLLSLWLSCLGTWLLARRYTRGEAAAAAAAAIGIMLPYRWIPLLGGSPMGLSLAWIPWVLLGVDLAVRDGRPAGGVLAGASILLAYGSDVQLFFFCALAAAGWTVPALSAAEGMRWREPAAYGRRLLALAPIGLFVAVAAFLAFHLHASMLEGSTMSEGRSWHEVALNSPRDWRSFFTWTAVPGADHHVFTGLLLPPAILAGGLAALIRVRGRPAGAARRAALTAALAGGVAVVVLLAMGAHGPWDGLVLRVARKLLPLYDMIRQATKIYCLMPTLLALLAALAMESLFSVRPGRVLLPAVCMTVLTAGAGFEYGVHIRPTVCLVDAEQPCYRAVAEDAARRGVRPHVLAVPLWPGDTSWSSIYQHYVALYRIRMINGYSPVVPSDYRHTVFDRFRAVNQGMPGDADLDALREAGIDYIILHELAFPDQVSPLSAGFTLRQLLQNPRLSPLARADGVWAFRIESEPEPRPPAFASCGFFAPTRMWEAERSGQWMAATGADEAASGGAFADLRREGAWVGAGPRPLPPRTPHLPDMRWMVRARGPGRVAAYLSLGAETNRAVFVDLEGEAWQWAALPVPAYEGLGPAGLRLARETGRAEIDLIALASGDWPADGPIVIPAAALLREAESVPETGALILSAERTKHDPVRGPNLPLPAGRYRVTLDFASPAPAGTHLGSWHAWTARGTAPVMSVTAGEPAAGVLEHPDNLPLDLHFMFARRADMTLERLVLARIEAPPAH
ncbi:MAG: hypothetical protein FJ225_00845 [Lentisphaerae bacterium]|nr:hypothetical protein [Lentisphaerota bacterium]